MRWTSAFVCTLTLGAASPGEPDVQGTPVITVAGQSFQSWQEYVSSPLFASLGLRCATHSAPPAAAQASSDCSLTSTTIRNRYTPAEHAFYRIPVVVHVLQSTSGEGQISDARIQSQIEVLNEDLRALPDTNGEDGTDARIEFFLATTDPNGNPSNGITRTTNDDWFLDVGNYWDTLAWDTNRYLNIYTNQASGALGYVPALPQAGLAGTPADRVVILWAAFGRNAPIGPPYDLGRTTTHEVGHYLGLYHTFDFGCGSPVDCYTSGDRICDTAPEAVAVFGCPASSSSCASVDPFHNYMDYSDDACYEEFTPEQVNRMRCTLEGWRPYLPDCNYVASISVRNAGTNLSAYTATPPVLGGSTVLNVTAPTYTTAIVVGYGAPASQTVMRGLVILVDGASPFFFQKVMALPSSGLTLPIPNKASLCGRTAYTQAILMGGHPFSLSNAVDMTIGE